MLRDACRHEALAKVVLQSPEFYQLFDYVQGTAFDVSSDAFSTLKDLLTRHKSLVAEFLTTNYDEFFKHYSNMISAENYVTNRQALKLLGELLLERHNFSVMTKYIADPENLKLIMNLLKSEKKQIAFEAFHCFKPHYFVFSLHPPHVVLSQQGLSVGSISSILQWFSRCHGCALDSLDLRFKTRRRRPTLVIGNFSVVLFTIERNLWGPYLASRSLAPCKVLLYGQASQIVSSDEALRSAFL
ncbi:unnamed protein product [Echinostoma caproni]|uniref:Calcium-binding protein 39-like n=1 Tax=Echinostoma caproni TaxID=27848 RepID=A0A183AUG4_9TREM|nr:unnamed protein product [Echinostoma caproni]